MYDEAIRRIAEIEQRCDTSGLLYRGVSYWPLCRHRLWVALIKRLVISKKAEDAKAVSNAGPSWSDVGQVKAELAGPPTLGLLRTGEKAAASSLKPRALFFLRPEEYADKVSGRSFAKILDSLYERAALQGPATKIELSDPRTMGFPRLNLSLFLHLETAGRDVAFDPPGTLENFALIDEAVKKQNAGLELDAAGLLTDMGKIFYFARIFEKLLRVLGPQAFFLSVYYHPVGMAWMLACRWTGVKSVDLQHGRLGPYEGRYTQFTAAPPDGYHLMPDYVWCWGAQTKHDIDVDKNPACTRHGGLIGGNPWLYKWRYGDAAGLEPPEVAAFAARTDGKRRILVSLQPLDSPIGPELLKAMQQSPPEWLWLLRMHPLRKHTMPEIAAILHKAGLTNVELELSTSLPLFSLLKLVEHHVTVFSSVAVEAAAFGIRTSLLGEEGQTALGPQMKLGICRYTPSGESLLTHIAEILSASLLPIQDDFIDMRKVVVDAALQSVLG
jgi:hypothetical protein